MANGNGNQAVLDFLQRADSIKTLTTKQKNEFITEGVAIIVRSQMEREKEWNEYKAKVDELSARSIGLWVYGHPKMALTIFLALYSFSISDIRQPFLAWLTEIAKLII